LNIKGPRLVTAADIPVPKGVNVINSHQYIATVAAQSELKLELKIESGKGYCNLNGDGLQDGFWNVDAVFTPVKNVNYKILDSYCFDSKVVEDLELEITTDGSVTPTDALLNSAKVLQNLFGSIVVSKPKIAHKVPRKSSRNIFIEELQLSARAYNCLNKMDIKTIEDLMQYSLKELKEIKNFGQKSVDEVIKKLKDQFDIHLN
jgi:DNA-directed RNA polymerase subunit alpha